MIRTPLAIAAIALAGTFGAGVAQARGHDDARVSVTIGAPVVPAFATGPTYVAGGYGHGYDYGYRTAPAYRATPWDRDGDGIPNRVDRVYNPRWDRDGDGIPNRFDRVYNPRWDRDGDGIPNRVDRHPNRPDRGTPGYHDGRGGWHGR